jgi:LacI family transcriptional regulator
MKISLSEIAHQLKVSNAVVSLVLNGKAKKNRISDKLIQKVLLKAEELGYTPNVNARSLRTGKTSTIGLVVSDISNIFFAKLSRYIENEAAKRNYQVIIASSDENTAEERNKIQLLNKRVDGLIIVPTEDSEDLIMELRKNRMPFVLIDRYFPRIDTDYIVTDNYAGSFEATEHLIKQGYKRIGFVGFNFGLINYRDRLNGFQDAMRKNKIRMDTEWVVQFDYRRRSYQLKENLKSIMNQKDPVRALLLANNNIGIETLNIFNELKIRVPQDIALVCFDDDPAFQLFYSPITVVSQRLEEIAKQSVEVLFSKLEKKSKEYVKRLIKPELIIRKSCGSK